MSNLNNEIEEASVGTMMPIVTPEETLAKSSPVSIDEAFNALRLDPEPDPVEDTEDNFDESVAGDISAKVQMFKHRKKFPREAGSNWKENQKEFCELISKIEKILKEKDKTFIPYGQLKRKVSTISPEEMKDITQSTGYNKDDYNISMMELMYEDKVYGRALIVKNTKVKDALYEISIDPMDAPRKYWRYYADCISGKYFHGNVDVNFYKKVLAKLESGNDVKLECADDILHDNGIESVLYESLLEWENPDGVVFEESDLKDFGESAQIDDDIKDTIKTLNEKGYETKYSCSGHPSARLKSDGKRDGIKDKKLYSTAKIVFAKDYDFSSIPDGWEEKKLDDGNVGIYVKGPTFKIINGLPTEQFYKWKAKYMNHLRKWADELPDANNSGKKEEEIEEAVNEVFADLLIDLA